jgi:hypothetical protein
LGAAGGTSERIGAWNGVHGAAGAKRQRDKINENAGSVGRAESREGEGDAGFIVVQRDDVAGTVGSK